MKRVIREIHRRSLWQVLAVYAGTSWVVLEAADVLIERLSLPDWIYGFAIILLLAGLPIILATAFVQEGVTSRSDGTEAPAVTAEWEREAAATRQEGNGLRRLLTWRNAMAGGVLALALWGVVATGWYLLSDIAPHSPGPGGKSVAVLPLANLSGDEENEYFAQGMTEELISKLSRVHDLQVAARTSVERYRDTEQDIREIAAELDVRYVLEGSVRKSGDRVRITAQLIDASTGFHLWSDDFGGQLEDVFAVQEETALKIAEALDLHLSPQEAEAVRRRYTENAEAYDAYLRGWALVESFHTSFDAPEERLEAANQHFQNALTYDPDYALAVAGRSLVEGYYYLFDVDRSAERLERSEELARRALALDPQFPEGHAALAHAYGLRRDFESAVAEYRRALRLDPDNAYVWCEFAWACNNQDPPDPQQAEEAAREAIRLAPSYFWSHHQLGRALFSQGRYEQATGPFEFAVDLNPDHRGSYFWLGETHLALRDYGRALTAFQKAGELRETPGLLLRIGAAYAGLGQTEEALTRLEAALASGYRNFDLIEATPHLDPLRDHPRFRSLMETYE